MAFPYRSDFDTTPELFNGSAGLEVRPVEHTMDAKMFQKPPLPNDASNQSGERNSKRPGYTVPFGLRSLTFGVLVALVTLIIAGAAIGGGLGSSLAAARQNGASPLPVSVSPSSTSSLITASTTTSSSSTVSPTVYTNYVAPDPSTVDSLASTCQNGSIYQTLQQALSLTLYQEQTFRYLCNRRYIGDTAADRGGTLKTLASFVSYTAENCIESCSNMNGWANETVCRAITFSTNLAGDYEAWGTNCWLFNDTGGWMEAGSDFNAVLE